LFTAILVGEAKGYTVKEIKLKVKQAANTGEDSYVDDGDSLSCVELNSGVNWLLEDSSILFVRKCDEDLFSKILDVERLGIALKGVLVTGNPGIGKSWFAMLCLMQFAKLGRTVVYEHADESRGWLFCKDGSILCYKTNNRPTEVDNALDDPHTILLFDPVGKGGPPRVRAFTIVFSSPAPKNYHDFLKRVIKEFKMPCWSVEAIKAVALLFGMDSDRAVEQFNKYGGIPRYVFSEDMDIDIKLDEAVRGCNFDRLRTFLASPEASLIKAIGFSIIK